MRFGIAALASMLACSTALAQTTAPVTVSVDLSKKMGELKPVASWFGYDEANYTTMRDGKQLLRDLRDLSPVPVQIRAHHLFTSGDGKAELKWSSTNIYTEDASGKPVYNFKIIDEIFDEFKAAGVVPMVELGFMPEDLTSGKGAYKVPYPGRTVSGTVSAPPKDFAKWQELCRVFAAHLSERYGAEVVKKWYFEVWNEPDIDYWHGTPEEYWKLYDHAVAGVRAAIPGARVGGPATTGPFNHDTAGKFLSDFLNHVYVAKVPIDFISFHVKGRPTFSEKGVLMSLSKEMNDADVGFGIVAKSKYPKLPIILSEADPEGCAACSMKVNPSNGYRNGTLYPAYTAAALKGLYDLDRRHSVNLISMLSWSFEFEDKEYFEGFRSLATNGIDKPILNLFRMVGMMRGARVAAESNGATPMNTILSKGVSQGDLDVLAATVDREANVLVWHYQDDETAGPSLPASVMISGLPKSAQRVLVTEYRIDDKHSNAYTIWKAMGSPQKPSAAQLAELKARDGLELYESPRWVSPQNGAISVRADLQKQSVSLFQVRW